MNTPHLFLVGDGATRFAHKMRASRTWCRRVPEAEAKYRERMKRLAEVMGRTDTTVFDWREYWNFPNPMPPDMVAWRKHG